MAELSLFEQDRVAVLEKHNADLQKEVRKKHQAMCKMVPLMKMEGIPNETLLNVVRLGWDSVHWRKGYTLLHYAAECIDDPRTVELIGTLAPDVDAKDELGHRAIDYARHRKHKETEKVLKKLQRTAKKALEEESKKHKRIELQATPEKMQSLRERLDQMEDLPPELKRDMEKTFTPGPGVVWSYNHTPLHAAAKHGNVEAIKLLVESRADITMKDDWKLMPIDYAVRSEQQDATRAIQELTAAKEAPRELVLHAKPEVQEAASPPEAHTQETENQKATPKTLGGIANIALNCDYHHQSLPLENSGQMVRAVTSSSPAYRRNHSAAHHGAESDAVRAHIELHRACELVKRKGWSRVRWPHGYTVLHMASHLGEANVVRLLIELAATVSIEAADEKGLTPLHYARNNGHEKVLALLVTVKSSETIESCVLDNSIASNVAYVPQNKNPELHNRDVVSVTAQHEVVGRPSLPATPAAHRKTQPRQGLTRWGELRVAVCVAGWLHPKLLHTNLLVLRMLITEGRLKAQDNVEHMSLGDLKHEVRQLQDRVIRQRAEEDALELERSDTSPRVCALLDEHTLAKYVQEFLYFGREKVEAKLQEDPEVGGLKLDDKSAKLAMNLVVLAAKCKDGETPGPGDGIVEDTDEIAEHTSVEPPQIFDAAEQARDNESETVDAASTGHAGERSAKGSKGTKGPKGPKGALDQPSDNATETCGKGPKGGAKGPKGPAASAKGPAASGGKGPGKGGPAPKSGAKGGKAVGGKGAASGPQPTKPKVVPKQPMKPLWWNKMNFGPQLKPGETIWDEVADDMELLPVDPLVLRFCKTSASTKSKAASEECPKEKQEVKLLRIITDPNVVVGKEAALKQLPPPDEVARAIKELNDTALTIDMVKITIDSACPDPGQKKQLEEERTKQPDIPMAIPEQYMWVIGQLPAYKQRLDCWTFVRTYREQWASYNEALTDFVQVVECFQGSDMLPSLLGLILAVGNYLNGGTNRGQADGFDLETLGKLDSIKDAQGKDIRHYILDVFFNQLTEKADRFVEELAPFFVNVNRRLSKDSDGTEKLNKSARITFEDFDQCVQELKGNLDKNYDTMQMILQYFEDPAEPFRLRMPKDFAEAKERIDALVQLKDTAKGKYGDLLKWFKISGMKSSEFCLLWDNLLVPSDLIVNRDAKTKKEILGPVFCQNKKLSLDDLLVLWQFRKATAATASSTRLSANRDGCTPTVKRTFAQRKEAAGAARVAKESIATAEGSSDIPSPLASAPVPKQKGGKGKGDAAAPAGGKAKGKAKIPPVDPVAYPSAASGVAETVMTTPTAPPSKAKGKGKAKIGTEETASTSPGLAHESHDVTAIATSFDSEMANPLQTSSKNAPFSGVEVSTRTTQEKTNACGKEATLISPLAHVTPCSTEALNPPQATPAQSGKAKGKGKGKVKVAAGENTPSNPGAKTDPSCGVETSVGTMQESSSAGGKEDTPVSPLLVATPCTAEAAATPQNMSAPASKAKGKGKGKAKAAAGENTFSSPGVSEIS